MTAAERDRLLERARLFRGDVDRYKRDDEETYAYLASDHPLRTRARRRAATAARVADEYERRAAGLYPTVGEP